MPWPPRSLRTRFNTDTNNCRPHTVAPAGAPAYVIYSGPDDLPMPWPLEHALVSATNSGAPHGAHLGFLNFKKDCRTNTVATSRASWPGRPAGPQLVFPALGSTNTPATFENHNPQCKGGHVGYQKLSRTQGSRRFSVRLFFAAAEVLRLVQA